MKGVQNKTNMICFLRKITGYDYSSFTIGENAKVEEQDYERYKYFKQ